MSVDRKGLIKFGKQLEALKKEIPDIMSEIAVGEGVYAVKQARLICKNDKPDIVNAGTYRRNWDSDKTATRTGKTYFVRVFNPLDYAQHLEHGFRSHFVPGHWEGHTFVYNRDDPEGGMFVGPKGGYVPGHYTLKRAVEQTRKSQNQRVQRKFEQAIKKRLE